MHVACKNMVHGVLAAFEGHVWVRNWKCLHGHQVTPGYEVSACVWFNSLATG